MSILYVTQYGSEIRKDGNRIKVTKDGSIVTDVPLNMLEKVVLLGPSVVTGQAAKSLLRSGVSVLYCSTNGEVYGRLQSFSANTERLFKQVDYCRNEELLNDTARNIVSVKVRHQKGILARFARNHPNGAVATATESLKALHKGLGNYKSINELRGLEGRAAAVYFSVFANCLTKNEVVFDGRTRRPPKDPVNALLSLGYTLLLNDISFAAEANSLHMGFGCLHASNNRHPALLLDIIEIFRQPMVDRLVLKIFNTGILGVNDFNKDDDGGYRLKTEAFKKFIEMFTAMLKGNSRKDGSSRCWQALIAEEVAVYRRAIDNMEAWQPSFFEI